MKSRGVAGNPNYFLGRRWARLECLGIVRGCSGICAEGCNVFRAPSWAVRHADIARAVCQCQSALELSSAPT
eukprot:13581519-Alexandrium_andersonii.AAC.1